MLVIRLALIGCTTLLATHLALAQPAPGTPVRDAPPANLSPYDDASIADRPPAKPISARKIILVGDSTTQVMSGWGGAFCAYHVTAFVACVDLGRGGRSTYSYRAEGSWKLALSEMGISGYDRVYVLIQFGHNDQPGKAGRSTNLRAEFPQNLRRYVEDTRAAGAVPVLLTPLTRREFENGVLLNDLEPWAAAIRELARDMNVPLVDLHALSAAAVQKMGPQKSACLSEIPPPQAVVDAAQIGNTIPLVKTRPVPPPTPDAGPAGSMNMVFDYTHVGRAGADVFSAIVADGLSRAVPELRSDIIP